MGETVAKGCSRTARIGFSRGSDPRKSSSRSMISRSGFCENIFTGKSTYCDIIFTEMYLFSSLCLRSSTQMCVDAFSIDENGLPIVLSLEAANYCIIGSAIIIGSDQIQALSVILTSSHRPDYEASRPIVSASCATTFGAVRW